MSNSLGNVVRVLALRGLGVLISLGTAIGIAFHFGAGPLSDAFFLVRRIFGSLALLVESLCSLVFVPGLVRDAKLTDQRAYLRALRRRELGFFGAGALAAVLSILFAPQLVALMAPGLNPEAAEAGSLFFAIMALTLPITLSTAFVGAALTALRRFSLPVAVRLAPRALILLAVLLVPLGMGMTGIVVAAVLGHCLMLGTLWLIRRRMANAQDTTSETSQADKPPAQSNTPRTAAMIILSAYFLAVIISESYAASLVGVGAIAILSLGQRISTLGVSEMLSSVLTVYYTNFSEKADDAKALAAEVRAALRTGYFFTAPLTLCLAVLASVIAQLVLANGAFSSDAAAEAGALVAWFAMAALANTGMSILETALLARSERRIVRHFVVASVTTLAVRLGILAVTLPLVGLNAIGMAAVAGPIVMALFHHRLLRGQIGPVFERPVLRDLAKVLCAALVAAGLCVAMQIFAPMVPGKWGLILTLVLAMIVAVPVYLLIGARMGIDDASTMVARLTGRLRK